MDRGAGVFTEFWHQLRSSDQDVEIELIFVEQFGDGFFTGDVCTSFFSGFDFVSWDKCGDTNSFTSTVWQADSCADVLVGLAWVNTQYDVDFNAGVKFSRAGFDGEFQGISEAVCFTSFEFFGDFLIFFAAAFEFWTSDRLWTIFDVGFGFLGLRSGVACFFAGFLFYFCFDFF